MASLTPKQAEVLDAIRRHIGLSGQSPTVREIGLAVNLKSSCSVQKHLNSLEKQGHISRNSFKYRSITLAENQFTNIVASVMVPLLGHVAGGIPIAAEQEIDPDILSLPESFLPRADRSAQAEACATRSYDEAPYFALTVKGESMNGAGIGDGDVVVARRQHAASNGDIVIALIGSDEATVKRFFRETDGIRLQPENPHFEPLITQDVRILGKVALSIKRFS